MIRGKRLVLLVAASIFGLYIAFMVGYYATSQPGFCRSCHLVEPYVASWEQHPHKSVNCLYCHEERGFLGKVEGKLKGLNYYYLEVTNQSTVTTRAEVFEQNCLQCHLGDNRQYPEATKLTNRPINHYEIIAQDTPCTSCHVDVGHQNNFYLEPDLAKRWK